MTGFARICVSLTLAVFAAGGSSAATFTVNDPGDIGDATLGDGVCETSSGGGACTLRAAIEESNALAGVDTIGFSLAAPHRIEPGSPLPAITDPVAIDGTTQPGYSGTPIVELVGTSAGASNGLRIDSGSSLVRGLAIGGFNGWGIDLITAGGNRIEANHLGTDASGTLAIGNVAGIVLDPGAPSNTIIGNLVSGNGDGIFDRPDSGGGHIIQGNFVGTDVSGTQALGNTRNGILIQSSGCLVGGTTAAARNVASGNGGGITVSGVTATDNVIQGNYIGTDSTGTVAIPNSSSGITIAAVRTQVGGTTTGARNVISGNSGNGVLMANAGLDNVVEGNYIGVDVTGSVGLGNAGAGVTISIPGNRVGGPTPASANVVSSNGLDGVVLTNEPGNVVQSNFIGTDPTGTLPLGNGVTNGGRGVRVSGSGTIVTGNTIAFNPQQGVLVFFSGTGSSILSNSIYSNGGMGIDISPSGPNPNDPGDADVGINDLQNYPEITLARSTFADGFLDSTPGTIFTLELFSSPECDDSGFGEGKTVLAVQAVTTSSSGIGSFSVSFPSSVPIGHFITATSTNPGGSTSEFSLCAPVEGTPNQPPLVEAGPNTTILGAEQPTTVLQGTASDPDAGDVLTYRWLDGATELLSATPVGAAGEAFLDLALVPALAIGSHTLTLEVTDGQATVTDELVLTVDNSPPTAAASGGGTFQLGTTILLTGQVSDFDGDTLGVTWLLRGTPDVVLQTSAVMTVVGGAPVAVPTFDATGDLGLGVHTPNLVADDGVNEAVSADVAVEVIDTEAPTVAVSCTPSILWPPNHQLVPISVTVVAEDNSGTVTLACSVTADEPADASADGSTEPDFFCSVTGGQVDLLLRAERQGKGDGRTYTVTITGTDPEGNASSAACNVVAPHDRGKKK